MGLSTTLAHIRQLPPEEAVTLLEQGLREPYPEIQNAVLKLLTEEFNRSEIVLENYSHLLPEVRNSIREHRETYLASARSISETGMERSRQAAYEFIAEMAEADSAALLSKGAQDASAAVRALVIGALEKIALRYHYHLLRWQTDGNEESRVFIETHRAGMHEALESLLKTYGIHHKDIFVDIAVDSGTDVYRLILTTVLNRADSPLYQSFNRALLRTGARPVFDLLFRLFFESTDQAQQTARTILSQRRDPGFLTNLAQYLDALPQDRYQQITSRMTTLPWAETLFSDVGLDQESLAIHRRFIVDAALPPNVRDRYLSQLLSSPLPRVRAETLRLFDEITHPGAVDLARRALSDPSDEVQLEAARILIAHMVPDRARLLSRFLTSDNEELRRVSARELAQASFKRYMESFHRLEPRTRELAARAIAKIDDSLVSRLGEEVRAMEPDRRLKALQILDYIDKGHDVQKELQDLLSDPDRRIRATAVKLIEVTGNIEGMKLLLRTLNDTDRRVRANTVEAFEEIGDARFAQILLPFCQDPDNRVRANAVKALWNLGRHEVIEVLREMLQDEDPKMRLSAVWALNEIRYDDAAEDLAGLLRVEKDPTVRAKAAEVFSRLQALSGGAR